MRGRGERRETAAEGRERLEGSRVFLCARECAYACMCVCVRACVIVAGKVRSVKSVPVPRADETLWCGGCYVV